MRINDPCIHPAIGNPQSKMQHEIPVDKIGPNGAVMAGAVSACVHCGFCLAACPTYKVLGEEMDSPRGRIILMKNVLEGGFSAQDAAPYIDRCLGCLGCVTACPSGVQYGELLTAYRAFTENQRERPAIDTLARKLTKETLPHPGRFRAAATAGKLAAPFKGAMPGPLSAMLSLLPKEMPKGEPLPDKMEAAGKRRARVALLTGCVQSVLTPQTNWATLRVLVANGVEVVIPQGQGCCGALGMHTGDAAGARELAEANLKAFSLDVDAIVSNAAGCGSTMKEYELLFRGTRFEEKAHAFAAKVKDISEFLDALGLVTPQGLPEPVKVAYHDACHLAHAQGIVAAPRRLLKAIPNLTLVEIPEGELCCGSAGTYNIEQPAIANMLGERKVRNVLKTDAEVVATGNIGCLIQLRTHLANAGTPLPVVHTMELLDAAYR